MAKAKKKNLADKVRAKRNKSVIPIAQRNPFEIHINRDKMPIIGKKSKNDRGLPGVARSKSLHIRKNTLLNEYKGRNRTGTFADRRIGEYNNEMSSDDRIMARYTAARQKSRTSRFNLAGEDDVLTHRGQTLANLERFDDIHGSDDEEHLNDDFVDKAHFGGGLLGNTGRDGATTHKSLIEQLISDSKKRKADQQHVKEATLELTNQLDTEWRDLLPLMVRNDDTDRSVTKDIDDYDKTVRGLVFEPRGTVSDRLKSENEIAVEEKNRLEQLENERLERMKSVSEVKCKSHKSADDLDDETFTYGDDSGPVPVMMTYDEQGQTNIKLNQDVNEEEDEESAEQSDESTDEEDAEISSESDQEEEGKTIEENPNTETLPYTFKVPDTYEELVAIFENHPNPKNHSVIIERMIKCNHPQLAQGNKLKLTHLFAFLLQYLNDLDADQNVRNLYETFALFAPQLHEIAQLNPEFTYKSIMHVLKEKYDEFKHQKNCCPTIFLLILLKLISLLFSTSDFRHPVVTPSLIFMEKILQKMRITQKRHISYCLFVITLILEYTTLSKRFSPLAINFLLDVLRVLTVKDCGLLKKWKKVDLYLDEVKWNDLKCEKMLITDLVIEDSADDDFKMRLLSTVLRLISEFVENLSNLPSSVEIFDGIRTHLETLKDPPEMMKQILNRLETLKMCRKLEYLVIPEQKAKALRLYEPKIQEITQFKRHKSQSAEKAERDKLLHKVKVARKGALREIRKDSAFLGQVKIRNQIRSDNVRKEKVKRIYAEAALQQNELKNLTKKRKQ